MDHLNASGRGHKDRLVVLDARDWALESRMWLYSPRISLVVMVMVS